MVSFVAVAEKKVANAYIKKTYDGGLRTYALQFLFNGYLHGNNL